MFFQVILIIYIESKNIIFNQILSIENDVKKSILFS